MDNLDSKVYGKEVIEFTAVANEYCAFVESAREYDGIQILKFMQKLLPLLYSKVLGLPDFQSVVDEDQEKFVTEGDWQDVHDILIVKFGEANDYLEVIEDNIEFSDTPVSASISENLADIYQDLKDFLIAYSIGTVELMNEAIWNCQESFTLYWGQKLVNLLRAIHSALKYPERVGQPGEQKSVDDGDMDTSDWIISKRQSQLRGEDDEEI